MDIEKERRIDHKREFAKHMRKHPTPAEAVLWEQVRKGRLGYKFQHQALVWGFIVDFWCPAVKLAIEVDGPSHQTEDGILRDNLKQIAFCRKQIGLLRFTNDEVFGMLPMVLDNIKRECAYRALLPLKGFAFVLEGRDRDSSSSRRSCGSEQKGGILSNDNWMGGIFAVKKLCTTPESQRITAEEWSALARKLEAINVAKRMELAQQPAAQKAWEQKYRLAKHLERKISEAMKEAK